MNFIQYKNNFTFLILGIILLLGCNSTLKKKDLKNIQIDTTSFSKVLEMDGFNFHISSIKGIGETSVTVKPNDLLEVNRPESLLIEGQIVSVDIADLNVDGSPEILIISISNGSGSYGNVQGYSVNNKKSMSQFYFPPTTENSRINKGYMGHDEFSIVGNSLIQRFPIYLKNDTNANPTGGIREVTYKLIDGEASRRFEIIEILELKN